MKVSKTSIALIAIAGLLAISPSVRAQTNTPAPGQGRRGMSVDATLTRMTEQLKLTDEQKPKVKAVLEEQNKKMQELRSDTSVTPEDRRTKMQAIRDDINKQMKGILTAEQYTQYEQMMQRNRGGRRNGAPGGGGAGGAGGAGGGGAQQ